ncbi:hypothetical protein SeMB42_g04579 [Synchytrium endobioticum]|uniref:Transcriptional regulatory protein RXT2 N-terminal domain-containing protein n=1 Tax=Synchytrium endobioticum TaxID=286115 RepID=A0A507CY35_9FUNG|nr:hypothetical protein SeMB42_g04579 [Synchytrium endobioticum]TPX48515.1 hypothetical protein SeLEV6574_g02004 [Synchytrium endobioticum]
MIVPSYPDYGPLSYRPFNRGNKLHRRDRQDIQLHPTAPDDPANTTTTEITAATTIRTHPYVSSRPSLWGAARAQEELSFTFVGSRRILSRKAGLKRCYSEVDTDDDPYTCVKVDEIWAPPEKVEDVRKNKALMSTLRSRHIKMLAETAIELIEREQSFNKLLNRLANVVHNDDPLMAQPPALAPVPLPNPTAGHSFLPCLEAFFMLEDGMSPNGIDTLKTVRELVEENIGCGNEYIQQLGNIRNKLTRVYEQKKALAKKVAPSKSRIRIAKAMANQSGFEYLMNGLAASGGGGGGGSGQNHLYSTRSR